MLGIISCVDVAMNAHPKSRDLRRGPGLSELTMGLAVDQKGVEEAGAGGASWWWAQALGSLGSPILAQLESIYDHDKQTEFNKVVLHH